MSVTAFERVFGFPASDIQSPEDLEARLPEILERLEAAENRTLEVAKSAFGHIAHANAVASFIPNEGLERSESVASVLADTPEPGNEVFDSFMPLGFGD